VGIGKLRRSQTYERALLAAALAAAAAFLTAAAIDWVWELTVVPVAFLLLAGAVLRTSAGGRGRARVSSGRKWQRIALGAIAVLALAVIVVPTLAVRDVRNSQADARSGQLGSALDAAKSAGGLAGFAATPSLQQALVLESQGNLNGAAGAARDATHQESTNWRTWLTLSRIEAERDNARAAVDAYRTARSLNPRSALFATAPGGSPPQ
jgi:cytochrome c-type biogenesis protein CcmH/NrfG